AEIEAVLPAIDLAYLVLGVIGIERERVVDPALRILRGEALRIEEPALHAIVPARHRKQHALQAFLVGELTAREHRQRADRESLRAVPRCTQRDPRARACRAAPRGYRSALRAARSAGASCESGPTRCRRSHTRCR